MFIVFFDIDSIILRHALPDGKHVNSFYYGKVSGTISDSNIIIIQLHVIHNNFGLLIYTYLNVQNLIFYSRS